MKIIKFASIIITVMLLGGCGDQFWCGEEGCNLNRTSDSIIPFQKK